MAETAAAAAVINEDSEYMYLPEEPQKPLPSDCCGTGKRNYFTQWRLFAFVSLSPSIRL